MSKALELRVQTRRNNQAGTFALQIRSPFSADGSTTPTNHLCEFLLAIEPDIAGLAATRRSAVEARLYGRLVDGASAATSPREWIGNEIALHHALAELSGNLFFQALQTLIMTALSAALFDMPVLRMAMLHRDLMGPNRVLASAIADGDFLGARAGALEVIRQIEMALRTGNGN